jgi:hypothetical protein
MKSIAVFVLFLGMFLVVQGYYQQKLQVQQKTTKENVKFIPRTLYDEQLSDEPKVSQQFRGMFDDITVWPSARG